MKKICCISTLCCLVLTGCGDSKIYDEPANFSELQTGTYVNPNDPEDTYKTVIYDSREYVLYGTQGGRITDDLIEACVGYTDGDPDNRVYTLNDTGDYLAEFYVSGIMEQFGFLRAADTIGQTIETPDYIDSLDYDIWK